MDDIEKKKEKRAYLFVYVWREVEAELLRVVVCCGNCFTYILGNAERRAK